LTFHLEIHAARASLRTRIASAKACPRLLRWAGTRTGLACWRNVVTARFAASKPCQAKTSFRSADFLGIDPSSNPRQSARPAESSSPAPGRDPRIADSRHRNWREIPRGKALRAFRASNVCRRSPMWGLRFRVLVATRQQVCLISSIDDRIWPQGCPSPEPLHGEIGRCGFRTSLTRSPLSP
jgi:hypothetical protein